jgi:hypothetical protein
LPPPPEKRERVRLLVRDTIAKLGGPGESSGVAIAYHVGRLMGRGLEESAAYMQACALVGDPHHAAHCEYCREHPEDGKRLRASVEEAAYWLTHGPGIDPAEMQRQRKLLDEERRRGGRKTKP